MGYVGYQEGIYPNRCWFFVYFDHKSFNFKSDLEIPSHGIKDFQSAAGRGWIRLRDPYSALFSQLGWMHRRSSNDHTSKNLFGTYCFFFFLLRSSINLLHYTAILENLWFFWDGARILLTQSFSYCHQMGKSLCSGWALSTIQRIHIQWLPMLLTPSRNWRQCTASEALSGQRWQRSKASSGITPLKVKHSHWWSQHGCIAIGCYLECFNF